MLPTGNLGPTATRRPSGAAARGRSPTPSAAPARSRVRRSPACRARRARRAAAAGRPACRASHAGRGARAQRTSPPGSGDLFHPCRQVAGGLPVEAGGPAGSDHPGEAHRGAAHERERHRLAPLGAGRGRVGGRVVPGRPAPAGLASSLRAAIPASTAETPPRRRQPREGFVATAPPLPGSRRINQCRPGAQPGHRSRRQTWTCASGPAARVAPLRCR